MSSSVTSIALLQKRVEAMLPSLSKAEAMVLGLLSYGILLLNGCGISRLSHGLAKIEQARDRLRLPLARGSSALAAAQIESAGPAHERERRRP